MNFIDWHQSLMKRRTVVVVVVVCWLLAKIRRKRKTKMHLINLFIKRERERIYYYLNWQYSFYIPIFFSIVCINNNNNNNCCVRVPVRWVLYVWAKIKDWEREKKIHI